MVIVDDQIAGVTPDNAEDEIEPPNVNGIVDKIEPTVESTVVDSNKEEEEQGYTTLSNRISCPFDIEKAYPAIYIIQKTIRNLQKIQYLYVKLLYKWENLTG